MTSSQPSSRQNLSQGNASPDPRASAASSSLGLDLDPSQQSCSTLDITLDVASLSGRGLLSSLQGAWSDCSGAEAVLHQILNAIADPVFVKDPQGRWCFLNEAYCALVGYSQTALLGQSELAVFSPAEAQPFLQADQQVLKTGEAYEHEAVITDAQGRQHVVLSKTARFLTPGGEPMLVGTMRDITERLMAEQKLQRQAERERLLGAIAPHLLQALNPAQLRQTTVNEIRRFLGVDRVLFYSFDPSREDTKGTLAGAEALATGILSLANLPPDQIGLPAAALFPQQGNQIQAIADVTAAHLPAAQAAQFAQHQIQACLVMPIIQGEALYGLVCVHHCRSPRTWADWEIEALKEVVSQISSAIKQANLIQQVRQLNAALERQNAVLEGQVEQRTGQLSTALEFEATLKRITDRVRDSLDQKQIMLTAVREITEALGVKGSNTALYDLEQGTSTIYYEYNRSLPSYQGRVAQMEAFPEVYHQLLDGQFFQFCSKEPNPVRGHVAMLACPILDDRGVLGDLWLIKDKDSGFNELEIRLVQQVANQCAIAIRQARLYQAAQSQVEELERLNRLKDDFLSTVSHELRTPVTSMRVALQLLGVTLNQEFDLSSELQKPKPEQNRLARYYHILQEECEREISLINDLLDLQRLDVGNHPIYPEAVVLPDWLPTLVNGFMARAKSRQQSLNLQLPADLPTLSTDLASLERVLAELLNNACKYTPPGENIYLEVLSAPEATTHQVHFRLTNTGTEIPAAELPRIFDKFYRVPSADPWKQGGTGLGLALVQKLVQYLGGEIVAESHSQKTAFTVKLPTKLVVLI